MARAPSELQTIDDGSDGAPTRVDQPDDPAPVAVDGTFTTPLRALEADEIERFNKFYWAVPFAALFSWIAVPLLEGSLRGRWAFAIGVTVYAIGATWFRYRIRDPRNYNERTLLIVALSGVVAGYGAIYYWGVFSPAPVVIAAVLFQNSLISTFRYTLTVYLLCAVAQAGLSIAIIAGFMDDPGLLHASYASVTTQVVTQGVLQLTLLAAFVGGRFMRKGHLETMTQLERTSREMARREALLNEAREELHRAAWNNAPGRFSEQVIGSFQLGNVIGRGGMGEVYDATHVDTGQPAAVKLLQRNCMDDPHHRARFFREAEIAAAIGSPHVVEILEVGGKDAAFPYLAMERLRGEELAARLRSEPQLSIADTVKLIAQVARGLEAARDSGIVHRDIKPHNIFHALQSGGPPVWKILDFGVSKLAGHGGTLTKGNVVGTPTYMAPEQARGEEVDHRADVYALGAVAYRALTGRPPFPHKEVHSMIHDVVYRMPDRPSSIARLPLDFDTVLAVVLCKNPDLRFSTAEEFAAAFAAARDGRVEPRIRSRGAAIIDTMPWGQILGGA